MGAIRHRPPKSTITPPTYTNFKRLLKTFDVILLIDGNQTPMSGYPVFIAQHATVICCRECISMWHGIEKGRELNGAEVDDVMALIRGIDRQINEKMSSAVWGLCGNNYPKSAKVWKISKNLEFIIRVISIYYRNLRRLGNSKFLTSNPSDDN